MFVTHRRKNRLDPLGLSPSSKAAPPPPRKPAPSAVNRKTVYLQPQVRAETAGSDNLSARLEEIAMRFDLLRSACCPVISETSWRGLLTVLKDDLDSIEAEAGPVGAVVNRVLDYADVLQTNTGIEAEVLARQVTGWTEAQAVAVVDLVWRFWRVSAEVPFRQRLTMVGARVVSDEEAGAQTRG